MELLGGLVEWTQGRSFSVPPELVNEFVDTAVHHRVLPLLFSQLAALPGVDLRRVAALDLLERHHYSIAEKELQRIQEIAESIGVEFAVLKGPAHAERWFRDDPVARQFSDLDLFIDPSRPGDVDRVLKALDPNHELNGMAGSLMAKGVLPDIPVRSGPLLVELHSNPMSFAVSSSEIMSMWHRTEPWTTRSGVKTRRFEATHAVLHSVINSAKDNHAFLLQLVEVGRAISDPSVDWMLFEQVVKRNNWDAVIHDALEYVCDLFELERPPVQLRPRRTARAAVHRLTPHADRLGGRAAWRRAQRFAKLDLAVPGTRVAALAGIASRTLSPDLLIRAYAPDLKGPYLLRAGRYWVRRQQYVKGKRSELFDEKT